MCNNAHRIVIAMSLLAAAVSQLSGATPTQGGADLVASAVADLDAPDFTVRENASKRLQEDPEISLDAVAMALAKPDLTAEQQQRLMTAIRERFVNTPRPAIGISFSFNSIEAPRGLLISGVFDGFPAVDDKSIQYLDIIESLDGESLQADPAPAQGRNFNQLSSAQQKLRAIVMSHDPGEQVPAVVLRLADPHPELREVRNNPNGNADLPAGYDPAFPRKQVSVKLTLGRYDRLPNAVNFGDLSAQARPFAPRAIAQRLKRLGVTAPTGPVVGDASRINDIDRTAPQAAMGWMRVGVVGGGREAQWNADFGRIFEAPNAIAQANIRRLGGNNAIPAQMVFRNGQLVAQVQGNPWVRAPAPAPAMAVEQRVAITGGAPAAGAESGQALSIDGASAGAQLREAARLRVELDRQESLIAEAKLDQPTMRAAEALAADLRVRIEMILNSLRVGTGQSPTVTTEGSQSIDQADR